MNEDIIRNINNIVWFIPIKKLRDSLRNYMISLIKDKEESQVKDKEESQVSIEYRDHWIISSFRESIENDRDHFLDKYNLLIKNLDNESIETVSYIMKNLLNYNKIDDPVYAYENKHKIFWELLYHIWEHTFNIGNYYIYNQYILPKTSLFPVHVFYEKYGLNNVKNIEYLKNKDIIDAGGYIGDTAIVFSEYTNGNVYSFEPLFSNYNIMKDTIKINNKNNIIPVCMALGNENKDIFLDDIEEFNMLIKGADISDKNKKNKVSMVTLDSFVDEKNIEVGLIKTDLEGFEKDFIEGAINTIKKQKPILIISIYHSYDDFFDIKRIIEDLNLGYEFKIIKPREQMLIADTILLAEACM